MPVLQVDEFKTRQRATWDAGEASAPLAVATTDIRDAQRSN
jgi:hypothetical protein